MNLEQRLIDLSIPLPAAAAPGANYAAGVVHRDVVWISGQLPRDGDRVLVSGKLGKEVSIAEAQGAARAALLRALAALRDTVGDLRRVRQIVKLTMYVNCSEDFSQHSAVADGASDLIYELFGPELGRHARTSVGVAQLPRNACLELDIVATLEE